MTDLIENFENDKVVTIVYTNWKGETAVRRIKPKKIYFGNNEWHPTAQWLLEAYDIDKQDIRDFALKDIRVWF